MNDTLLYVYISKKGQLVVPMVAYCYFSADDIDSTLNKCMVYSIFKKVSVPLHRSQDYQLSDVCF